MTEHLIGLDLSLRATGIVVVPIDWKQDWKRVVVGSAGSPLPKTATEADRMRRLIHTREAIASVVRTHGCKVAVLEQYAFSSMASQAHSLGELGGVVKSFLVELGLELEIVPPASARKLLGKQPRKGAKQWAHERLVRAGAPTFWTEDQLDAFIVTNFHLSAIGGAAVMLPAEAA